ncbi:NitT/TauT family transport system substrate-binding protein [Marinobacterium sp. MBR-109]
MKRRSLTSSMALLFAGTVMLPACTFGGRLKVGVHPWIGYETLYIAENFGWLADSVELIKQKNASSSLAALSNGELDAAALTLDEVLSAREQGVPLKVVMVFNHSVGADAVLARAGIRQLSELKGKRIAVEKTAVGALMLAKLLQASGLQEHEISVLDIPPDSQLEAWQQGMIDAAITYEPLASRLERQGGERVFDSRALPNTIFDVLAVLPDRKTDLVRSTIQAHMRGLEHIRVNRQDALHRIATWRGLSVDEVSRSLGSVHLPDLQSNHSYLVQNGELVAAAEQLVGVMMQAGLLRAAPELEGLLDVRYLPNGHGY